MTDIVGGGMSDKPPLSNMGLRDRIAECASNFLSDQFYAYLEHDQALELADAVIAALKLHVVTVGDFQTVIKGSYPKPLEES